MTPTYAIVPVKNCWELTRSLIWSLDMQTHAPTDVLILDNGSTDHTPLGVKGMKAKHPTTGRRMRPWLHRVDAPGGIYDLWNQGYARAKRLARGRRFNALLLNNDVILHHQTIERLSEHLRMFADYVAAYPDVDADWSTFDAGTLSVRHTSGVLGDGGMFGPAFMLRGEAIRWEPLVTDPAYAWWYGDNHLAECIALAGGKQVRVVGLPIRHENEGTARHHDLYATKLQDRGRWITRHQRGFGVAP